MGLFDGYQINAVNKKFIHPYWDVSEDASLKAQPGQLMRPFREMAMNPKVADVFELLIAKKHPDLVDNVFTDVSRKVPLGDLIECTEVLAFSPVFRICIQKVTGIAGDCARKLAERANQSQKEAFLRALDRNGCLGELLSQCGPQSGSHFLILALEGIPEQQQLSTVTSLNGWRGFDHSNIHWYEWLNERLPHLLPGLRT